MADAKAHVARPLSPHLQIYRWSWTMAMSIFHRATGVALYAGTVLLAAWLLALASGPAAYERLAWLYGSPVGLVVLFGYTWALMHHMLGGVRHLVWDFGHGMEPGTRMTMARMTLILSPILTILIWVVGFAMR
ncbi:succinate dehydrogenase, cytochrome b556 subunit [Enterovirga sp.]|jgi:succinate dehydrogenase / fumarate reductase cytochrome b subunit|uniref:succinate dehydrogenase, cytochrome b556 subunit n=1 Tax=Enterovirga sp. TaxID=2026350 RepID=UPI0026295B5C|nr:succinate dehydrogenase, cytochrome b556 subunit [Enterovirga sp.]MDB5592689.1 sdhC [Enterovirga sp.]